MTSFTCLLRVAGPMVLSAILTLAPSAAIAQGVNSSVEREVIVEFAPGTLTYPVGRVTSAAADLPSLPQNIRAAFDRHGVREVARAFPAAERAAAVGRSLLTGEDIKLPDLSTIYILRASNAASALALVKDLRALPSVLFADPNGGIVNEMIGSEERIPMRPEAISPLLPLFPDDPEFDNPGSPGQGGAQWNLLNTGQSFGTADADIDAPEAWEITTGSSGISIAIIDAGVDASHLDLDSKVSGDTQYSSFHGTAVAGVAAAKTNNNRDVAGVDWNAQIVAKVYGDDTATYNAIISSVQSNGARVTNSSFALCASGTCDSGQPQPRYSTLIRRAYATTYKLNAVNVVASGNYFQSGNQTFYPGAFGQGIITVGATDRNDNRSSFSSTGNQLDLSAPGTDIRTLLTGGGTVTVSGTSFATPAVAGTASLMLSVNPNLANDDIENILMISSDDVNGQFYPGWDPELGAGRLNARRALDFLRAPYLLQQPTATGGTQASAWSSFQSRTIYDAPGLATASYLVKRYEVQKVITFPTAYQSTPRAWCRGAATTGWASEPTFSLPWCEVLPGSVTTTGATLRTYVYEIKDAQGRAIGWFPSTVSGARFAYSVLGVPPPPPPTPTPLTASLSGPGALAWKQQGTYTGGAYGGGSGAVGYAWDTSSAGSGSWYSTGVTSRTYTLSMVFTSGIDLRVKVQRNGQTAYATKTVEFCGYSPCGPELQAQGSAQARSAIGADVPSEFVLHSPSPNPTRGSVSFQYDLPEPADVQASLYDLMGREVLKIEDSSRGAGYHDARFNTTSLPAGVYLVRVVAGLSVATQRIIVIR